MNVFRRVIIFAILETSLVVSGLAAPEHNVVAVWNDAALIGVRDSRLPAPEVARALAVVSTCIYDAWAAYDDEAFGTQLRDVLRQSSVERTLRNKEKAISFAAFRALSDVLPASSRSVYIPLMAKLGYDSTDTSTELTKPSGIGNVACAAVLEYRHHDGSNQLGDLSPGPYSDWTGYAPRNKPTSIPVTLTTLDPDHWQPLIFVNGSAERVTQTVCALALHALPPMFGPYEEN